MCGNAGVSLGVISRNLSGQREAAGTGKHSRKVATSYLHTKAVPPRIGIAQAPRYFWQGGNSKAIQTFSIHSKAKFLDALRLRVKASPSRNDTVPSVKRVGRLTKSVDMKRTRT